MNIVFVGEKALWPSQRLQIRQLLQKLVDEDRETTILYRAQSKADLGFQHELHTFLVSQSPAIYQKFSIELRCSNTRDDFKYSLATRVTTKVTYDYPNTRDLELVRDGNIFWSSDVEEESRIVLAARSLSKTIVTLSYESEIDDPKLIC